MERYRESTQLTDDNPQDKCKNLAVIRWFQSDDRKVQEG